MKIQSKTAGKLLTYALLGSLTLGLAPSVLGQQSVVNSSPEATKGPSANFIGTVWTTSLVPDDTTFTTVVGKVVFEPGARSNWHSHPSGQLLIVTDGVGYHQIKGEPKQTIRKGDTVPMPSECNALARGKPRKQHDACLYSSKYRKRYRKLDAGRYR